MSLQDLFAERARRCEADQKRKDDETRAAEQAEKKAKADARRAAIMADPKSPQAIQAKYAEEVRRRLAQEKRHKAMVLARIQDDKLNRKEIQNRNRLNAMAAVAVPSKPSERSDDSDDEEWAECEDIPKDP